MARQRHTHAHAYLELCVPKANGVAVSSLLLKRLAKEHARLVWFAVGKGVWSAGLVSRAHEQALYDSHSCDNLGPATNRAKC